MLFDRPLDVFRDGYQNRQVDEAIRWPRPRVSKVVIGVMYQNTIHTVGRGFLP